MAALSPLLICALCFGHGNRTSCRQRFAADITRAAERFALPRAWICAVIEVESGGHQRLDGVPIVSARGAMGLMQLMPKTFAAMARRYHLPATPFAARENILAGAGYLHRCYLRFGFPLLFSAYAAGPDRVEKFIIHGEPLPRSARDYTLHILHSLGAGRRVMVSVRPAAARDLFVTATDGNRLFARPPSGGASTPSARAGTPIYGR
jgi:hypothetical protein